MQQLASSRTCWFNFCLKWRPEGHGRRFNSLFRSSVWLRIQATRIVRELDPIAAELEQVCLGSQPRSSCYDYGRAKIKENSGPGRQLQRVHSGHIGNGLFRRHG